MQLLNESYSVVAATFKMHCGGAALRERDWPPPKRPPKPPPPPEPPEPPEQQPRQRPARPKPRYEAVSGLRARQLRRRRNRQQGRITWESADVDDVSAQYIADHFEAISQDRSQHDVASAAAPEHAWATFEYPGCDDGSFEPPGSHDAALDAAYAFDHLGAEAAHEFDRET
eukprot:TRINITY_DN10806_c0_g1_i3.p2 TRINITY_DN10806_c0_g1~~TRINITY_DN10806_c0_g1_i3.p2  ORF type:complete len:171 (+),score=46.71 TRINITY_DN10806_c0_g1_i3:296-808(+)